MAIIQMSSKNNERLLDADDAIVLVALVTCGLANFLCSYHRILQLLVYKTSLSFFWHFLHESNAKTFSLSLSIWREKKNIIRHL